MDRTCFLRSTLLFRPLVIDFADGNISRESMPETIAYARQKYADTTDLKYDKWLI